MNTRKNKPKVKAKLKKTVTVMAMTASGDDVLSLLDLCRALGRPAEHVIEMVEYGVVEPSTGRAPQTWQFPIHALERVRVATHLEQDFNNLERLALALDLLQEVKQLRHQVRFFEQHFSSDFSSSTKQRDDTQTNWNSRVGARGASPRNVFTDT